MIFITWDSLVFFSLTNLKNSNLEPGIVWEYCDFGIPLENIQFPKNHGIWEMVFGIPEKFHPEATFGLLCKIRDRKPRRKPLDKLFKLLKGMSSVMKEKMESMDKAPSVVSRTVSLGPDTGDVKKLKGYILELEKRINEVRDHLQPILAEFRTG